MGLRLTLAQAAAMGIELPRSNAATLRARPNPASDGSVSHKAGRPPRKRAATDPDAPRGGRVVASMEADFHVRFEVPVTPRTKARARMDDPTGRILKAYAQHGHDPSAFRSALGAICRRPYTDKETKAFEATVARFAAAAMRGRDPFKGPVEARLVFLLPGREGDLPVAVTDADVDNLAKAALDAVNGIVFHDDRFACRLTMEKRCHPEPGLLIEVRAMRPEARTGRFGASSGWVDA